ncbi:MAG: murein biosynthesis integral membrane protein MurJ [Alphaproteobacteria bacterium]|nr:murein biosynthesis integral membrane protein MurJ [Alphaproteobacteria bacterium]
MSLIKSVATVGSLTFASRILGFARDIVIASVIGTGPVADAWAVAFRFPNLFRRLFAEGAFNSAFVPLYARRLEGEGDASATLFAEHILSVLLAILLAFSAIAIGAMPWIMIVYAPGFIDDPAKLSLAADFTQIAFPYLLFMSLCALYGGILNSHGRFGWAAGVQALLNVGLLAALGIAHLIWRPALGASQWGYALAIGCAGSGILQFVVLAFAAERHGWSLRLRLPEFGPDVSRLFRLAVPGIVSGGVSQISIFIATIVASLQDGAPAILYYADRIYQFPLGIVGVAMGIVLLPMLARHLRAGRDDLALHWQNRGLEVSMLLTLPASVALMTISVPIAVALFERGAFTRADSVAVGTVLIAFGAGLPAFILNKVLTPGFFAREDTATPMRFAVLTLLLDVALSVGLFFLLGVIGIAIGTAVAAWANVALLWRTLASRGQFRLDDRVRDRLPRIVLASLGMGLILVGGTLAFASQLDAGALTQALVLACLCAGGLIAYALLALLLKATTIGELRQQFSRGA